MIADRVDRLRESPPLLRRADTDPLRARRWVLSLRHDTPRHLSQESRGYTSSTCATEKISAGWGSTITGAGVAVVIMLVALLLQLRGSSPGAAVGPGRGHEA